MAKKSETKNKKKKEIIKTDLTMSTKEIDTLKRVSDNVTRNVFENNKTEIFDGWNDKEFDFANKAFSNATIKLGWQYEKFSKDVDAFDKAVYDSVCTLYNKGFKTQTIQQIYELTTGKPFKSQSSQIERIEKSMERLESLKLDVIIDDKEIKLFKNSPIKDPKDINRAKVVKDKVKIKGRCIGYREITVELKNKCRVDAYLITDLGVVWDYANWANQILTVPRNLLDLPLRSTNINVALREVLLSQLYINKEPNEIRTQRIFEKAQIDIENTNVRRLYSRINSILDMWADKGFIKGYFYTPKAYNKHYKLTIVKPNKKLLKAGE